ncbi:hypothetical protein DNHGIG_12600 [Collibacillus ludicampi]|uniref:Uncharacterized protein n=1 Tax=Collibacillus ludicampi TaxID=2771369 RepID=A0AAV4LD37_9BACL|nr:hypothetical protein [Collibacillus ludicampi]GIM45711.1 hypothetical protein DNHGIG_12600 [Collibacillus ludicampi]
MRQIWEDSAVKKDQEPNERRAGVPRTPNPLLEVGTPVHSTIPEKTTVSGQTVPAAVPL